MIERRLIGLRGLPTLGAGAALAGDLLAAAAAAVAVIPLCAESYDPAGRAPQRRGGGAAHPGWSVRREGLVTGVDRCASSRSFLLPGETAQSGALRAGCGRRHSWLTAVPLPSVRSVSRF